MKDIKENLQTNFKKKKKHSLLKKKLDLWMFYFEAVSTSNRWRSWDDSMCSDKFYQSSPIAKKLSSNATQF